MIASDTRRLALGYHQQSPRQAPDLKTAFQQANAKETQYSQHQSEKLPAQTRVQPRADPEQLSISSISHPKTEQTDAQSSRHSESSKINELTNGSLSIKGNLVHKGRCPKCTLKPPCKHFQTADELPSVAEVQPSIKKMLYPQPKPLALPSVS